VQVFPAAIDTKWNHKNDYFQTGFPNISPFVSYMVG